MWGWQIDPEGLRYTLNQLWDRYEIPLMVAENGLGAADKVENGQIHDSCRIDYFRKHIKAIRDDNGTGSFARIKKDSFAWYKRCIETNGEVL